MINIKIDERCVKELALHSRSMPHITNWKSMKTIKTHPCARGISVSTHPAKVNHVHFFQDMSRIA